MHNHQVLRRALRAALIVAFAFVSGCGTNSASALDSIDENSTTTVVKPSVSTPPPAGAAAIVTSGLQGDIAIADNFDVSGAIEPYPLTPVTSDEPRGAFRMTCMAGQISYDDPIVYPGQRGVSHLHQFWGNTGTDANSTYESLRATGDTTCGAPSNLPINRTAYWMPAMLDGAGHVIKPDNIQIYYKQSPADSAGCRPPAATACVGLPNGIKSVFGYNMATHTGGPNGSNRYDMHYECWSDDTGTPALNGGFKTIAAIVSAGCPAGARLIIVFVIPPCWDGVHLDSADHRSHLVSGTGESGGQYCPSTHPYKITAWQGQVRFTTDANFTAGKWRLSSDDMESQMTGAAIPAGSTLHFDYFEAWSPTVKAKWQKNCIDAHLSCADGQLGDGTHIKTVTVLPTHQLVTL